MRINPEYWESDSDVPSWGYFADGALYDLYSMPEAETAVRNATQWSHSTAVQYLARNRPAWRKRIQNHYTELLPDKSFSLVAGPALIMLFESAIPASRYLYRDSNLELALSATALNDRVVSGVVRNLARAWGNLNSRFLIESVALDIDSGCISDNIIPAHFFGVHGNPSSISRIIAAVRGAETVEELNKALESWRGR